MLRIQPSSILLGGYGTSNLISLTSESDKYIIFKAKTTNNEVMTAKPQIGIIPPGQKTEIVIKAFADRRFYAKILISFASIELPGPQQQISDIWREISSSAIQRKIIEVKKDLELSLIQEQQIELPQLSSAIKSQKPKKPTNQEYQKLYIQQVNYNNRLSQQVEISEKSLANKLRQQYQKRIMSLFPSQDGLYINITYTWLVLGVLISFFTGYLLAKF